MSEISLISTGDLPSARPKGQRCHPSCFLQGKAQWVPTDHWVHLTTKVSWKRIMSSKSRTCAFKTCFLHAALTHHLGAWGVPREAEPTGCVCVWSEGLATCSRMLSHRLIQIPAPVAHATWTASRDRDTAYLSLLNAIHWCWNFSHYLRYCSALKMLI